MNLKAIIGALRDKAAKQTARMVPFVWRVRRDLPPHFLRMQESTECLDAAVADMESRFLKISNTLEQTTNTGLELVEYGEALLALAMGQGGGVIIIETTAEHIWHAIEFVDGNVKETEKLIQQLIAANEQITGTLLAEEALKQTLAPLNYVQTLFRVESVSLPAEVQTMFHALVVDIGTIRENVESGFHEKFQLLRDIQRILRQAIDSLSRRAAQTHQTVDNLRSHLSKSLAQMTESYEKNRDRDTRLSGITKAVMEETGRVVMSLQFYDAFTQRFQHARSILAEMNEAFSRIPGKPDEVCRMLRFLEQAGKVSAAQIEAINIDLVSANAEVQAGLSGIMEQMRVLDNDCLALSELDSVTASDEGAVQILLESLEDTQKLVEDAGLFASESCQTIEPVDGMTTHFTSFIQNLSLQIQLIGLNAEVHSAHVGEGTGLEFLSARTSAIARETSQLSTRLALDLDLLTDGLAQIVSSFRAVRERSDTFSNTLASDSAADIANLHAYRDSSLKVLLRLSELLTRLEVQTVEASEQSNFVKICTEPLTSLHGVISTLTSDAQSTADRCGIQVDTKGMTDHFLKRYSMKAETNVHYKALGQVMPSEAAPVVDDFEFFGLGDESPAAPEPPIPAAADVELWLDPPVDSATPSVAPVDSIQSVSSTSTK